MTTIEQLTERMDQATTEFCKTRVPTGETGKYPAAPEPSGNGAAGSNGASISDSEHKMEQATDRFTKSKAGETSAA